MSEEALNSLTGSYSFCSSNKAPSQTLPLRFHHLFWAVMTLGLVLTHPRHTLYFGIVGPSVSLDMCSLEGGL